MLFTSLKMTVDEGLATLTLNRPAEGNTIDVDLAQQLLKAAIICDDDPAIRAVLLNSSGKLFCAGGDLRMFEAAGDRAATMIAEITAALHIAISKLARMPKPLITAIQGPAAGAGLGLALLGDIALATSAATFTPAYSAIGLTPDGAVSWILPRLIGIRAAQDMLLTNRCLSADEAVAMRLITRLVEADGLNCEALKIARALADGPTQALGTARRLIFDSMSTSLETHLEQEARGIAEAARSRDGLEGIAAFRARRRPIFGSQG